VPGAAAECVRSGRAPGRAVPLGGGGQGAVPGPEGRGEETPAGSGPPGQGRLCCCCCCCYMMIMVDSVCFHLELVKRICLDRTQSMSSRTPRRVVAAAREQMKCSTGALAGSVTWLLQQTLLMPLTPGKQQTYLRQQLIKVY